MLVLFDIDGTLLRARGVGVQSMERAFKRLHDLQVDTSLLDTGGRLDPHLFNELHDQHDIPFRGETVTAYQDAYVREMARAFEDRSWSHAMPGSIEMARAVHEHPELVSAVLTGNIEATSWLKLKDAGFERDWFEFGVFGDEGETRRDLPVVARRRHQEQTGTLLDPDRIVIIGDTPHDIDCAHHSGCRVIAVATGSASIETLREHQPDLLLESLEDTQQVLDWLLDR
jgi:phosphoglycolate phosphatase